MKLSPVAAEHRPTDSRLIDLLRIEPALGVGEIAARLGVTATAVRQRLDRLMRAGLVDRGLAAASAGGGRSGTDAPATRRGRPGHTYSLTEKGRRTGGDNFRDLAIVLWQEIRGVRDPAVRRGLIARIGVAMADMYRPDVAGETPLERLESTADMLRSRQIACGVEAPQATAAAAALPVLVSHACPYPDLAELDRGICAAERAMLQDLVGSAVRLSACRLDGDACCRFTVGDLAGAAATAPIPAPATCNEPR